MKLLGKNREEARRAVTEGHATIAVYGLGKMGLPLAAAFADAGARVIGVDVNAELVDKINSGECPLAGEPGLAEAITRGTTSGRLSATTDGVAAASEADLCAILVPTSLTQKNGVCAPDQGAVASVARAIAEGLGAGGIVVTECTMPPGSTEALVPLFSKHGRVLNEDYGLAHCPERTMSGTALRDIRGEYPKIIGASSPAALEAVAGVYEAVNSKGVIACSSIKTAELVKIFEGVYRDANIALANELAQVCREEDVDFNEIREKANTQPYCRILQSGCGVGGHCIPVYPHFIMRETTPLIRLARQVNDSMPREAVALTEKALAKRGRKLAGARVLVLGLTFRGGVKEFANSCALPIIRELKARGAQAFAFDPLCSAGDYERLGVRESRDFSSMDAAIIATDHAEFKATDWDALGISVLVDGRGIVKKFASGELVKM